ncbi:MAG: hypothetical protein KatS3mg105_1497 [Gemmatales bacterium]|nr:MAG: hypothetical protein KatS3mg105_1497 [Gemmatales bacterium]
MILPRWFLFLIGRVVRRPVLRHINAFEAATHRPREIQQALLRRILAHHADTDFGRQHHFRAIGSVEDFRRHLPIAGYEYFEPYIARVRAGNTSALLADPVKMFALTSGTTSARKFIPVTSQYLADYRRAWNIWGLRAYRAHQSVRLRPIVQMSSDCDEFRTEAGIPCGSVTGLTAKMQKRIIRWLYCVPPAVAQIKDPAAKYYAVLRLGMPKDVGVIVAANPSTLVNLARAGDSEKESLIRDIHDGTLSQRFDMPPSVREQIQRRLKRHPDRARQLERLADRHGHLYPRHYWNDCLLGCWTGGSVGNYLRQFPRYFGDNPVRDVGLIASEGRMSIPFSDFSPSGVLDITSHFFEFVPENEINQAQPTVLEAHEVKEGERYFILPTTAFGLYRYNIYDVVQVTGFYNRTPLVEFLSKGSLFANITGEKLSEYHVTRAMSATQQEMNLEFTTYSLAPCWNDDQPYYGLFIEEQDGLAPEQGRRLAEALDRYLCRANIEYESKRHSERLGPVRIEWLKPGTWAKWDHERLLRSGGTPEQYKHPCLIGDPDFAETIRQQLTVPSPAGMVR